jgi:hypothetical protein
MFYKRMIVSLDLDVNEVVYLRRAGKVMGAKYLGLESTGSMGTRHLFLRADGITETIYISVVELHQRVRACILPLRMQYTTNRYANGT